MIIRYIYSKWKALCDISHKKIYCHNLTLDINVLISLLLEKIFRKTSMFTFILVNYMNYWGGGVVTREAKWKNKITIRKFMSTFIFCLLKGKFCKSRFQRNPVFWKIVNIMIDQLIWKKKKFSPFCLNYHQKASYFLL